MAKTCRHIFDVLTIAWTKKGERAYPRKKCDAMRVFGSVHIHG